MQSSNPPKTRRDFLRGSALAFGGLALGGVAPDPIGAAEDPYAGLKVGMHSYTLRKLPLLDVIRITRDLGLKHLGLNPTHLALATPPKKLREARREIEAAGLEIMAVGVVGFRPTDPEPERIFGYAREMGMKAIVSSPEPDLLDTLDKLVDRTGIKIAIHNHGPNDKWGTPKKLLGALAEHHRLIGSCADLGHFQRAGVGAPEALRALGGRVYDVHLKDVDAPTGKGKSVVLGTGIVDLKAALALLRENKFTGHVALEYEGEPNNPVASVEKCLAYVRKCLA